MASKAGNTGSTGGGRGKRRPPDDRPAIWVGYGKLVKFFRERAGLTQQIVADTIGYSVEHVASVEQGRRPAKAAFTEAVEAAVNAQGALNVLQDDVDLAKLPQFFQDFAMIEMEALSRFSFDPLLIPGLLQTEGYARAVFEGHCPQLDPDVIEQRTEARLARQRMLTREPLVALSFILGEAALINPVGGEEVMRAQLRRLLELSSQRNIEIQVMPTAKGFHPGLNGPFVLLETAEHRRIAYIESQGIERVTVEAHTVSGLGLRYGKLRSQAMNIDESRRLIERLLGER